MVEQRHQVGIVWSIVDDEGGVNSERPCGRLDDDGVGVAVQAIGTLKQGDRMGAAQQPGGRQTGDAGANDGDALPSVSRERTVRHESDINRWISRPRRSQARNDADQRQQAGDTKSCDHQTEDDVEHDDEFQ